MLLLLIGLLLVSERILALETGANWLLLRHKSRRLLCKLVGGWVVSWLHKRVLRMHLLILVLLRLGVKAVQ